MKSEAKVGKEISPNMSHPEFLETAFLGYCPDIHWLFCPSGAKYW
jgi:hypothetical protein